ncbi:MAG TPA: hypothetical protein PLU50_04895, partial [Pseudobdellovibrionaceae bacterium]|nr:hypothetical protein [Pseudobdellovibrionaceae bacterium]
MTLYRQLKYYWYMGEGSERLRLANADNFIFIARMSAIGMLLFSIRYGVAGAHYFAIVCITAALTALTSIYLFYKNGINSLSTHLLMIASYWAMGAGNFINGGIDSNGIIWIPMILAFSIFFLSLKDFMIWAIIWFATLVVLAHPEKFGLTSMAELTREQMISGRIVSEFAVTLMLVVFFFSYRLFQERTIAEISQQKDELKHLNENLREAEAALARKLDENVRLLRVLSHDIATPIQVIMFMLTKLEENNPAVVKISNATKVMEEIVTSVREMQATMSGKAQVRREEVNLRELLDKVIDLFEE